MAAQLTSKVIEQEIDALVKNTTSQDIENLIARFKKEHPSAPPLSKHDIDNFIKARAIGIYMQKPRGRPKKNKDPLGAEDVDAQEVPEAVVATPAGDAEAEKAELQQKLDVTTEQLAQSHAKQVQMEAQIRELQAQMKSMEANETLLEVAKKSITSKDGQKALKRAELLEENSTIHEKMITTLNELDAAPVVIVPEEERQVSCFYTKKDLTQGDEKIYVVEYLGGPKLVTVIVSEGHQWRKVNGYESLIKAEYLDWDTFIEKHGGVPKSAAFS